MNKDTELFFSSKMLEEIKMSIDEDEYIIPTVRHPDGDALTTLFATVVKLHERVQKLETKLGTEGE